MIRLFNQRREFLLEALGRERFGQKFYARGPDPYGIGQGISARQQDLRRRLQPKNLAGKLVARHIRKAEVDEVQAERRRGFLHSLECFRSVPRGGYFVPRAREVPLNQLAQVRLIFYDEHANGIHAGHRNDSGIVPEVKFNANRIE